MKRRLAIIANVALMAVGFLFVTTNTYLYHRPATPKEFLKK
jgi:hypothetical protein